MPGQLGRPVWVDDPHFNLAYHVRHTALPPPGGEDELNNLMGRLMAVELDRHRPLWEVWMVEGLADGRWALISKVHHCMVDGVSGTDLMVAAARPDPAAAPARPPDAWAPGPEPSGAAACRRRPARAAAHARGTAPRRRRHAARRHARRAAPSAASLQGAVSLGRELQPTPIAVHRGLDRPASSVGGRLAPDLDELKAIRRALGGTVNDVVLAVIAGAFRDLLVARGDPVDDAVLRSLVPVSVRAAGDRTAEQPGLRHHRRAARRHRRSGRTTRRRRDSRWTR